MPKIKQTVSPAARFTGWLVGMAKVLFDGVGGLASKTGFSDKTLYRRLKEPDNLTIGELRRIRKALGVENSEFLDMLGKMI